MPPIQQFFTSHPWIITFVCAELLCLLARSRDITIAVKHKSQRTDGEQYQVNRGLIRSLALELFLFVPVSAILLLLSIAPFLRSAISKIGVVENSITFSGVLGLMSYGFPFAAMRSLVTRIALQALKDFAQIAHQEAASIQTTTEEQSSK